MPSVNVTTAAAVLVPLNYSRKGLLIQNLSDTDVFLSPDPAVTAVAGAHSGIKLGAGEQLGLTGDAGVAVLSRCAISAIHAGSGNKEVRYVEFQ